MEANDAIKIPKFSFTTCLRGLSVAHLCAGPRYVCFFLLYLSALHGGVRRLTVYGLTLLCFAIYIIYIITCIMCYVYSCMSAFLD